MNDNDDECDDDGDGNGGALNEIFTNLALAHPI